MNGRGGFGMSSNKITILINENDKNKILQVYEEYYGLMYHIAIQRLQDNASAQDAVSINVEKLILNLDKIEEIHSKKTKSFVAITMKNTAIDILRKQGKIETQSIDNIEITNEVVSVFDEVSSLEGYKDIINMINSLPETLRNAAVLSLLHELSYHEIAKILEVEYETVRKRIHRAKEVLRENIRKKNGGGNNGKKL